MQLDPDLLHKLRHDKGLKQEALAQDAGCALRTIQRAERGEPVQRHIALRIGRALDVSIDKLCVQETQNSVELPPGCVELVSCTSGRQLLEQVRGCFFLQREWEFDPTAKHRETIMRLAAFLNKNWIDPLKTKRSMFELLELSITDEFEALVEAGEVLDELSNLGLALLSGQYTCVFDRLVYDENGAWEPRLDQGSARYRTTILCVTEASKTILRRYPEDHIDIKDSWPMAPFAETRM